ncbi:tetratricopeptide repeat protein [Acidipila rosea]|uniref:Tetratricopeptide repeat protein n=1 Tax=Acidipila rosea TaxID=768535 RepID=A0A4R1L136_9BACT|nr:tetratricopeptide repeat protein [Acidipila rosea]TCK71648.1 tetratricopeptide repeat protein [Acidipila rosea]
MKLARIAAFLFAAMTVAGLAGSKVKSHPVLAQATSSYSDKVNKTYTYPFGKDKISAPGNAVSVDNQFIPPGAFISAEYCGHCHAEAYKQWRQSLHSNSFRTPFYRKSVNLLINTKGIAYARHCDSCHNPAGLLAGALDPAANMDRSFEDDGVTCTTCHSVQKLQPLTGNGSYVMGIPATIVDAQGKPIPGEVPYAEILANTDRHSEAVMKDFYRSAKFCAACHKANFPASLNEYKWIRAFTTYDEWQTSKFSKQNPLVFYTADYTPCQGCHMKRTQISVPDYGAKNGMLASHRWLAGNTAVPFYYGDDEQLQKTEAFLRSGNYLNVDIFAIKEASGPSLIAPLGTVPFQLPANETIQVYIVVQNKNIGHSLVPEVRDLYEAWVQFSVSDASGSILYRSGYLRPDGTLDPGAHSFTNRPVNLHGDFVDNHQVWGIHSVAYDNTIQPGRSALVRYEFRIPAAVKGPLTITARVNYRHLRQSYLNNVFGPDHPDYPVVEMASKTRTLNIGENSPQTATPQDNPEWMRWNNLGIALLDEEQYADSIHAFEQVLRLRPDYDDGMINVALTYIQWEKYADARAPLEHALALHPSNARALYYLAIVERREDHPEAEIADLQQVVAQFPEARDARRELGIAYYQAHQPREAVKQFEALQSIDPDDLTAHYNLAVLYRRLGMNSKASEQAALYATKRIDPGAPTYSLDYLRKHPEISTESVPWHVHREMQP